MSKAALKRVAERQAQALDDTKRAQRQHEANTKTDATKATARKLGDPARTAEDQTAVDATAKRAERANLTSAQKQALLAANKAKRAEAAAKTTATLAKQKAAAKPAPQVLKVGSGAAIGVATGAMDGQPHTKQAVKEAREREANEAKRDGLVLAKNIAGHPVYVKPDSKLLVAGVLYQNATRASEARMQMAEAAKTPKTVPAKAAKPAASKAAPKPKAPAAADARKITVLVKPCPYKAGTKAAAIYALFAKCKTMADLKAKLAENPAAYGDIGYVKHAVAKGYITVG